MFDGADLSAVYGMPSYDMPMPTMQQAAQPIPVPTQQPQQLSNPNVADANTYGKPATSPGVTQDASYSSSNDMYGQQTPQPKIYRGGDSFWDKIGQKKMEVIKMFVLSLVIVLGLSLDRLAGHYMNDYVAKAILTNVQEFMVRVSYPVGVILFLWIMKASM